MPQESLPAEGVTAAAEGRRIPTLSAVITTIRAFEKLAPTLNAALTDEAVIEVVLVVDGPGAATLGRDLDAVDAAEPRLRVLRLTTQVGGEQARRIGNEAALGELVWHLDDDVVPGPDCGRGHVQSHVGAEADIVLGSMRTAMDARTPVATRLYDEAIIGEWTHFENDPTAILLGFWAGNYSMHRTALLDLPPIPAVFRWTYHSDRAFGLECARRGFTAIAHPHLEGVHFYQRPLADWRIDCRRQGVGRRAIYENYGDVLGADISDPWIEGLSGWGRTLLRFARLPGAARPTSAALALATQTAQAAHQWRLAVAFARVLRSIEQWRGADAPQPPAGPAPSVRIKVAPANVSLLMVSKGPVHRVRAALERWRPHVAEIVLVADQSGDPGLLDGVQDLVDRSATVACAFPVESVLPVAWPLCSAAFILRADDDELPSETLLAELRSLTLDGSLEQAAFEMRWVWPNPGRWIDEYPWAANPQPRLLRNRPGFVHFGYDAHTFEYLDRPRRIVHGAFYHLRTLEPLAARQSHAASYAQTTRTHHDGRPANIEYLPELVEPIRRAVPPWDLLAIETIFQAAAAPAPPKASPNRRPAITITRDAPRLADPEHRASVRLRRNNAKVAANGRLLLDLVVANRGALTLPGRLGNGPAVALGTVWTSAKGGPRVEGFRLELGEELLPGRAVALVLWTDVPVGPGRWRVEVDLVEEDVRWFGDGDSMEVEVVAAGSIS